MVPQLRLRTPYGYVLVQVDSVLLIMRLVVSLIIETEDGENLVILLQINSMLCAHRVALSGVDLHIGSGRHQTLSSRLKQEGLSGKALYEHHGLCGQHGNR